MRFRKPDVQPLEIQPAQRQTMTDTALRRAVAEMLRQIGQQILQTEAPTGQRLMLQTFLGLVSAKLTTLPDSDLRELVQVIHRHSADLNSIIERGGA